MKKRVTRSLFLLMICIVFVIGITLSNAGIEVDIESGTTILQTTETKRDFQVNHELDVTYVQTSGEPEVILVLDRSNSMLDEGYDGEPVAKAVWDSVNLFLDRYYSEYPSGKVAVISFGTNAVKNDNWKYYDNIDDAKNEVNNIYAYDVGYEEIYEYVWKNNHWNKVLVGRDYTFYWLNWNHENGGTNLKEAYQYAETTIWTKDKDRAPYELNPNSVIVFSDGVATHGGDKSEEDLLYPTVHNSNTYTAMDAAESLDEVANIITVGYFEAIIDPDVAFIARDTLVQTNNGGFFEAPTLDDIELMFQSAHKGIKYVGTNAQVVETVEPEFYVDKTLVQPQEGLTMKTLSDGSTQLTWDVGALKPQVYDFEYTISVKPNALPTGDPSAQVNTNPVLTYDNLYGEPVTHPLDELVADIGPLEGVPYMTLRVEQIGSVDGGYLTGDEIILNHYLAYTNTADYLYKTVDIKTFTKTHMNAVTNPFDLISADWTINGNKLFTGINTVLTEANSGSFLQWEDMVSLSLYAEAAGDFTFSHQMDYKQYDLNGNGYNGYFEPTEDVVHVKESSVTVTVLDPIGIPVRGAEIYVDEVLVPGLVTNDNGIAVVRGLKTGSYHIGVEVPSGYEYKGTKNVVKGAVQDLVNLSYGQANEDVSLEFEHIFVKDIKVAAADGGDFEGINDLTKPVDAYVEFTLSLPYEYVELFLQDDYGIDEALDSTFVLSHVTDLSGNGVSGFAYNALAASIVYDGSATASQLPAGTYRAYGSFYMPPTMVYPDNEAFINIDDIAVQNPTDEFRQNHRNLYSEGLTIFVDTVGPAITADYDVSVIAGEEVVVDLDIEDMESDVVKYYIIKGSFDDEEDLLDRVAELGYSDSYGLYSEDWISTQHVTGQFEAQNPQDNVGEGYFEGSGEYTIYAEDAYGNSSMIEIFISVFSEFLDNI